MADFNEISERSLALFDAEDLQRLSDIARKDLQRFIANNHELRVGFTTKILCVALCQGAALHQVNKMNGVKDIDIYTFFAADEGRPFPPRRPVMTYDFGRSKFGRHPDNSAYIGRRVDCLGRSIEYTVGTSPIEALQGFLTNKPTSTARLLAQKAVIIIDPVERRGDAVWPKLA